MAAVIAVCYRPPMRRFWPVLVVLFVAFEASRAVWLGELLVPYWRAVAGNFQHIAELPWWAAIPAFTVALLTFVIPMTGVLFALRWLHRRLFRNGTVVNILLTKVNFR